MTYRESAKFNCLTNWTQPTTFQTFNILWCPTSYGLVLLRWWPLPFCCSSETPDGTLSIEKWQWQSLICYCYLGTWEGRVGFRVSLILSGGGQASLEKALLLFITLKGKSNWSMKVEAYRISNVKSTFSVRHLHQGVR